MTDLSDHGETARVHWLEIEMAELRAMLEEAEPWIGMSPGGPDSQRRMLEVRERVRAALAKEEE